MEKGIRRTLLCLHAIVLMSVLLLAACTRSDSLIKRTNCGSCATNASPHFDFNWLRTHPPFDGAVLWQKLQKLIDAHGGFVTVDELESTFGTNLTDLQYFGPKNRSFSSRNYNADLTGDFHSNAYYEVFYGRFVRNGTVINLDGVMTHFVISWPFPSKASSQCMSANVAINGLIASGWKRLPPQRSTAEFVVQNIADFNNPSTGSHITFLYGTGSPDFLAVADPAVSCIFNMEIFGSLPASHKN
jgi:hypothetical protein